MQTASDLKERGVQRTKVTRSDGTAFVTLESPALAQTIYTPEDGFLKVTEVYGYDADLDGPPRPKDGLAGLLAKLDQDELEALADTLHRGWGRAMDLYYDLAAEGHAATSYQDTHYALETVYMTVFNERNARHLGCRWSACAVCNHTSCGFCPACNPGGIAPNGEPYDDVEDTQ